MDVCPSNTTECLLRAIFNAQKCVTPYRTEWLLEANKLAAITVATIGIL